MVAVEPGSVVRHDRHDITVRPDADVHVLQAFHRLHGEFAAIDGRIQRSEQPDVVTCGMQVLRQSRRDIGEAACFGQGGRFGGQQADGQTHCVITGLRCRIWRCAAF